MNTSKHNSYDKYKTKLLHVVGDSVNYNKNTFHVMHSLTRVCSETAAVHLLTYLQC